VRSCSCGRAVHETAGSFGLIDADTGQAVCSDCGGSFGRSLMATIPKWNG
jgi:hypothetical protein